MALEKELVLENGIVTNYHMIQTARINFIEDICSVTIKHYVSKDIRDIEKSLVELKNKIDSLQLKLTEAEGKGEEDTVVALDEKLHILLDEYYSKVNETYFAGTSFLTIDKVPEDLSLSSFYKLITENFKEYNKAKKV